MILFMKYRIVKSCTSKLPKRGLFRLSESFLLSPTNAVKLMKHLCVIPGRHSWFLRCRYRASESLVQEVTRLVRLNPLAVSHIPGAINYLVTAHSLEADAPEVS